MRWGLLAVSLAAAWAIQEYTAAGSLAGSLSGTGQPLENVLTTPAHRIVFNTAVIGAGVYLVARRFA